MNEFQRKLQDAVGWNDYVASFADPTRTITDIDNYSYSVDENPTPPSTIISASVRLSRDIQMDGDCDFLLCYFSGFGRKSAGAPTDFIINPSLLIQIKDQSTGRNFFNADAPMAMLCGQMGFPFLLTSPRRIRARTTLTVSAIAGVPASWTGFYLTMHGARIYYAA